jgi:hypothetical protein
MVGEQTPGLMMAGDSGPRDKYIVISQTMARAWTSFYGIPAILLS